MIANDRASSTAKTPITLNVIGPRAKQLPEQQHAADSLSASRLRLADKQPVHLRRCGDEPALEYGCVDWFLYDKQRSQ